MITTAVDIQEITKTIESKLTESVPLIKWQVRCNDYCGGMLNVEIIGTIYVKNISLNSMFTRLIEVSYIEDEQWRELVSFEIAHGLADLLLKTKR